MASPLGPCAAQRCQGSSPYNALGARLGTRKPGTGRVWSSQVNRQMCALDVLGPDCDEHRKACLEIRSWLRHWLCLQLPSPC